MDAQSIVNAINASLELQALVPDTFALASALSLNRTKPNEVEIGLGTILDTIGLSSGNTLLDVIHGQASYKYVLPLLEQGRLKIASPLVNYALIELSHAGVITIQQANDLIALGRSPDPITEFDVRCAIYADDGSLRI